MINKHELRIGNLIYWDIPEKDKVPHTIVGITETHIQTTPISLGKGGKYYSGIPLTEEWIEENCYHVTNEGAGFESKHYWFWLLNRDEIYLRKYFAGGFIWGIHDGKQSFEVGTPLVIKYVHQLQNLIYSLTDLELQIGAKAKNNI